MVAIRAPLSARWGLHSTLAGRTVWTPNEHEPWLLQAATIEQLDEDLVARAGLIVASEPTERVVYSPGVHTTFGLPEVVA